MQSQTMAMLSPPAEELSWVIIEVSCSIHPDKLIHRLGNENAQMHPRPDFDHDPAVDQKEQGSSASHSCSMDNGGSVV